MVILPAIDLHEGKCVRLKKGDFGTAHKVAEDAVETARRFEAQGAKWLHMVDLDGARGGSGQSENLTIVQSVVRATGLKVELGGGIRTMKDVRAAFLLGVSRVVIGSAAVENRELVIQAVREYGDAVAVGIDALSGTVRTKGWLCDSGLDAVDFAREMGAVGVKTLIYTDIEKDGLMSGPSLDSTIALKRAVSCDVIASGGVTTVEDIDRLMAGGIDGAIIGKALYAGSFDLEKALNLAAQAEAHGDKEV